MLKKTAKYFFICLFSLFIIGIISTNAFAASVNVKFLTDKSSDPGQFVANLYKFALGIAGAAAFAVIIYASIVYTASAGNTAKQTESKDRITSALWGLGLLLAAYLILYTINPNLVNLTTSELKKVDVATIDGMAGFSSWDEENRSFFASKGIGINKLFPLTSVALLKDRTKQEVVSIAERVGSANIVITGGTESTGGHAEGAFSHRNGYKVDLSLNPALNNHIETYFNKLDKRSSDGAQQYESYSGAIYAKEVNPPPGASSSWAPHWDVLVK